MIADPRALLTSLFGAAVAAAAPEHVVPAALPRPPRGRTIVVGAGKAAAAMARTVEEHWNAPLSGLVVTRYAHAVPTRRIEVVEAGHPVPDTVGQRAAARMLSLVHGLTRDDLVLCLMSGGASALMVAPAAGLTLEDKQAVTRDLLACGATIAELNCVRKHLSAVKGGRLGAAAFPARVVTLIVSDVPGDDPSVVGSGPTVPDPTSFAMARAIIEKYDLNPPRRVVAHLRAAVDETPKPGDPRCAAAETVIVAKPQLAFDAAAAHARSVGITPVVLSSALESDASHAAMMHAALAKQVASYGQPAPSPCVLLSGGETTVMVRGNGRGGRNAEFALALALALDGERGVYALAADTDGIDGTEDNAGVFVAPDTLARAEGLKLCAKALLANNDAYSFFAGLGDLFKTGPTLTNVNDFRAILVTVAHRE
jgi:glycerate 2-kinase